MNTPFLLIAGCLPQIPDSRLRISPFVVYCLRFMVAFASGLKFVVLILSPTANRPACPLGKFDSCDLFPCASFRIQDKTLTTYYLLLTTSPSLPSYFFYIFFKHVFVPATEAAALHYQRIIFRMIKHVMKYKLSFWISPAHHLSEPQVIKHQGIAP